MNTLILDLVSLIDNHLTNVEDVFINYENQEKTKNAKVAVRSRNWKAILYYIQRDQGHHYMLVKMYRAACEIGDVKMMKLFVSDDETPYSSLYTERLKYLAKGRQYELLDNYLEQMASNLDTHHLRLKAVGMIIAGLLINGDIDLILSNKYGSYKRVFDNPEDRDVRFEYIYRLYKHQRMDILEALKTGAYVYIPRRHAIFGMIKAGTYSNLPEEDRIIFSTNTQVMERLFRYGTDEDLDIQMNLNPNSVHPNGLAFSGRLDRFKQYVEKSYISKNSAIKAAIVIDNVDLFSLYYRSCEEINYEDLIVNAINMNAVCILKFLLDTHSYRKILLTKYTVGQYLYVSDYKIANLLKQEKLKGRDIQGFDGLVDNTFQAGYDFF